MSADPLPPLFGAAFYIFSTAASMRRTMMLPISSAYCRLPITLPCTVTFTVTCGPRAARMETSCGMICVPFGRFMISPPRSFTHVGPPFQ